MQKQVVVGGGTVAETDIPFTLLPCNHKTLYHQSDFEDVSLR